MRFLLMQWLQWMLQVIAPAAGGWFTKQADFLTAANLNDVNDVTVGGQIQSVPSAVPASPPCTIVIPRPPARLFASAVPGAIENCTSMGEETGATFQRWTE